MTNLQGDVLKILYKDENDNIQVVISYTYDPYGKPLTTTGSLASTLGADNPLRYRGYVFDSETGLYYLQSRYYDPATCRFINADSYASTGQGLLGYNMFAYCRNSPIYRIDISGTTDAKAKNEDGEIMSSRDLEGGAKSGNGTQIYSYGYTDAEKLVPTQNDVSSNTGLSFSTQFKPGAATTTIEEVNSTGYLYAAQDGKYHVSVYPIGGTVYDWFLAGSNSIWTQT